MGEQFIVSISNSWQFCGAVHKVQIGSVFKQKLWRLR